MLAEHLSPSISSVLSSASNSSCFQLYIGQARRQKPQKYGGLGIPWAGDNMPDMHEGW